MTSLEMIIIVARRLGTLRDEVSPAGDPGGRPARTSGLVGSRFPIPRKGVKPDLCAHACGFGKRNGVLTSYGKP